VCDVNDSSMSNRYPLGAARRGKCIFQNEWILLMMIHSAIVALETERGSLSEAAVSSRTVVTFVTWLISRREFSSSELVQ